MSHSRRTLWRCWCKLFYCVLYCFHFPCTKINVSWISHLGPVQRTYCKLLTVSHWVLTIAQKYLHGGKHRKNDLVMSSPLHGVCPLWSLCQCSIPCLPPLSHVFGSDIAHSWIWLWTEGKICSGWIFAGVPVTALNLNTSVSEAICPSK